MHSLSVRVPSKKEQQFNFVFSVNLGFQYLASFCLMVNLAIFLFSYFKYFFLGAEAGANNYLLSTGIIEIIVIVISVIIQMIIGGKLRKESHGFPFPRKSFWQELRSIELIFFVTFATLTFSLLYFSFWDAALLSALCAYIFVVKKILELFELPQIVKNGGAGLDEDECNTIHGK